MEAGRKDQISRMRIILYGIGKRYLQLFDDDRFEMWLKNRVEIIGFADGDNAVWGKEIFYGFRKLCAYPGGFRRAWQSNGKGACAVRGVSADGRSGGRTEQAWNDRIPD